MLSPASLRVCCLAVMAPALTKADRRADCLPVVLSEPFCETKTVNLYNRKDKYIEAHLPKLPSKFGCLLYKQKKALIHKTWLRTHIRNSSPVLYDRSSCPPSDLHNGKLNAESKNEAWHGTSVTLAVADRVRLKYTMNKNGSTLKNMGLARTNVALSLQHAKKVNRITQFSPKDRGKPLTPDVGESSPDLPRSANSNMETGLAVNQVSETKIDELAKNELSLSCKSNFFVNSDSNPEKDVTLPIACSSPAAAAASHNDHDTIPDSNVLLTSNSLTAVVPVKAHASECPASDLALVDSSQCNNSLFSQLQSSSVSSGNSNTHISSKSSTLLSSKSSIPLNETTSLEKLEFTPEDFLASRNTSSTMNVNNPSPNFSIAHSVSERTIKPINHMSVVSNKRECCFNSVDNKVFRDKYSASAECVSVVLQKAECLLRIAIRNFTRKEIGGLVHFYQNKLGIPCQKQLAKAVKHNKEKVDFRTELSQNEEVKMKNMSTSELIHYIRCKESSASQDNLLLKANHPLSNSETAADVPVLAFAPEEVADVIHTCTELHSKVKKELSCVDPELTESSDESESDTEKLDDISIHKTAYWKLVKKRSALTYRATWLIARIHELENQHRTANGALQKVSSSLGEICFEEELATSKSDAALSSAISGDASSTNASKQKVKGFIQSLNGYLDNNALSDLAHIGQNTCSKNTEVNVDHSKADNDISSGCSRTRALNTKVFQKRKILVTTGLHLTNNKLAKLSSVGCHCSGLEEVLPCVLCMGRYQCTQSVDPDSMPLLERVSLLDSNFHPLLSFQKDVPLILHFENILKKNESRFQVVRPESPTPSFRKIGFGTKPKKFSDVRSRSQKLKRYARTLSEKYRNKHLRNTKHLRKHGLVFGQWKKYQNRGSFQDRNRFRRISIDSSESSVDSPVPSPGSLFDDSYDGFKKRKDENQFDIDDVIIPYSNKSARLVDFDFKDIVVPSFRIEDDVTVQNLDPEDPAMEFSEIENICEETFISRHESLEVEEKKINKRPSVMNIMPLPKRSRRDHRFDSRADSSGANTPDPTAAFCDQDMFQDQNASALPTPPALSPPDTPSSANQPSDDSQPSFASNLTARLERRKATFVKRFSDDSQTVRPEVEEVAPYELRSFPLTQEQYEEIVLDPYDEDLELTVSGPSSPASPGSTTLSTSTIEDITDPEWMVLRNNPEPGLKLKLAKR